MNDKLKIIQEIDRRIEAARFENYMKKFEYLELKKDHQFLLAELSDLWNWIVVNLGDK